MGCHVSGQYNYGYNYGQRDFSHKLSYCLIDKPELSWILLLTVPTGNLGKISATPETRDADSLIIALYSPCLLLLDCLHQLEEEAMTEKWRQTLQTLQTAGGGGHD